MAAEFKQILGIRFFVGGFEELLARSQNAGLIVIPSAPVLADLTSNEAHREAVEGCDFAITDSGFMVWLWLLRTGEWLPRISGLRYLRGLLQLPAFRQPGATFWIMPSADDAKANLDWLTAQGFTLTADDCYLAPLYPKGRLEDPALLAQLQIRRPAFIVINLGGGVQERLGYYLRQQLPYRPTIICSGAAVAFLSGRQADIPVWADRLMLGWFFRSLSNPARFIPRYWQSLRLAVMLLRNGAGSVTS